MKKNNKLLNHTRFIFCSQKNMKNFESDKIIAEKKYANAVSLKFYKHATPVPKQNYFCTVRFNS